MQLGTRIREQRTSRNLTQQELGERCYVTRQTVANWESGRTLPDIQSLKYLAETFNISVDALIADDATEIVLRDAADRREMLLLIAGYVAASLVCGISTAVSSDERGVELQAIWLIGAVVIVLIIVRFAHIRQTRNIYTTRQIAAFVKGCRSVRELPEAGIRGLIVQHWVLLIFVGMVAVQAVIIALAS